MKPNEKKNKKGKDQNFPEPHNDQIGENASEEFASDQYSNSSRNKKK